MSERQAWRETVWPGFVGSCEDRLRRGDVQTDPDGSRWVVVAYNCENDPYYSEVSRVRENSLAAWLMFGRAGKS